MTESVILTDIEIDAVGEISNMCMGTAATTLSTIFGKKVEITTPQVSISSWPGLVSEYGDEFVCVKVSYTQGIKGSNLLLLNKKDALAISSIMMMSESTELTEIELSAVGEVANQMIGASSTSLATIVGELIDIEPPDVCVIDSETAGSRYDDDEFLSGDVVQVRFKLEIEDLVDSYLLQLFPIDFAKNLCKSMGTEELLEDDSDKGDEVMEKVTGNSIPEVDNVSGNITNEAHKVADTNTAQQTMPMQNGAMPNMNMGMMQAIMPGMVPNMMQGNVNGGQMPFDMGMNNVNVQQAQFTSFMGGNTSPGSQPENIDLIMDVPLEVTVELGRTNKSISEILEFKPGTIVELNKVTGTPIDVLVNGKLVARGEVVVIDENFGIRIVDIIK